MSTRSNNPFNPSNRVTGRSTRAKPGSKSAGSGKIRWGKVLPWLSLIPALGFLVLAVMYLSVAAGFQAPTAIIDGQQGLEILDRNGQTIYTYSDEPGSSRIVPLNEISPDLINATIATEDANYWSNPGFNVKGLVRAVWENLSFWDGGSGGSSITQQLAKNLYIKPEDRVKRSPIRKIKETMIAFELTRRYSKEQILEWYLSEIFYGHGAYGIESASYRYMNKPPSDLTLPEAALLAGIPRSPIAYDPLTNFDKSTERQAQVIELMVRHKLLTREQADEALAQPTGIHEGDDPNASRTQDNMAPHFAEYVRDLLPSLIDRNKAQGQLRVTTTLDLNLQRQADDIVTSKLDTFEKQVGATNGALVSMDPKTGEILAMVGSHDFFRDDISGQVNNATAMNQPGSTMKPITYVTAFLKGWAPATIVVDEPIKIGYGDGTFTLKNADNYYRGAVPVRTALGSSLNVPAVKALQYAGLQDVYDNARKFGISTLSSDISNYGDAFTLGGLDANLLDMTYAYSVFANGGQQAGISSVLNLPKGNRSLDPVAVLKIETPGGKTLYKSSEHTERIVPANAVYLITSILTDDSARASMFGANSPLKLPGRPAAVKSGSSDETRDLWAIGYTPQLVTGVWVGNANNQPMTGATSAYVAAPIWSAFMQAALKDQPIVDFAVPSGVDFRQVCRETGQAPQQGKPCTIVTEPFMSGKAPSGAEAPKSPTAVQSPTASPTPSTPTVSPTATPHLQPTTSTPVTGTPTQRPATSTPRTVDTPRPTDTPRPQPTQPLPTATPRVVQPTNTPVPQPTNTPSGGGAQRQQRLQP